MGKLMSFLTSATAKKAAKTAIDALQSEGVNKILESDKMKKSKFGTLAKGAVSLAGMAGKMLGDDDDKQKETRASKKKEEKK